MHGLQNDSSKFDRYDLLVCLFFLHFFSSVCDCLINDKHFTFNEMYRIVLCCDIVSFFFVGVNLVQSILYGFVMLRNNHFLHPRQHFLIDYFAFVRSFFHLNTQKMCTFMTIANMLIFASIAKEKKTTHSNIQKWSNLKLTTRQNSIETVQLNTIVGMREFNCILCK